MHFRWEICSLFLPLANTISIFYYCSVLNKRAYFLSNFRKQRKCYIQIIDICIALAAIQFNFFLPCVKYIFSVINNKYRNISTAFQPDLLFIGYGSPLFLFEEECIRGHLVLLEMQGFSMYRVSSNLKEMTRIKKRAHQPKSLVARRIHCAMHTIMKSCHYFTDALKKTEGGYMELVG